MGTSAPPARGYADDQRVDNYDSPDLFVEFDPLGSTTHQTPWMDVSRYACLAGTDKLGNDAGLVQFAWSPVSAAAGFSPSRSFTLSQLINGFAQYRIENLGPWLQITWTQPAGGAASHSARLFGTNRFHPLEFIPQNALIIPFQSAALAAGASALIYPSDYYAGPLHVTTGMGVGWIVGLSCLDAGGVWRQGDTVNTAAGNNVFSLMTPPGAWRLSVFNQTGGANTYFVGATHSPTGST